jgi:hypothetical protein
MVSIITNQTLMVISFFIVPSNGSQSVQTYSGNDESDGDCGEGHTLKS